MATTVARFGTCAVTADGDAVCVDPELAGVLGDVSCRAVGVVGSCRKFVLGREPIVHRYHDAARCIRETAAETIVRVEIADHKAAAVEVDEGRQICRERWAIHADRNLHWTRDHAGIDLRHRFLRTAQLDHLIGHFACLVQRKLVQSGTAGRREQVEKAFALWMECHEPLIHRDGPEYDLWP
jgi:hypothetical protein